MRTLLLLRGSAGCGKSTWITRNNLMQYTLSVDNIRMSCQSPVMQPDGSVAISQSNDKLVWKILFELLENRMKKGEFTVIDATNSKTSEMNRYKELCDIYRYRIYCVDFTDIPIKEVKRRNSNREGFKKVPEEVIDKMYSRFETQKIPSGIKVIKPNELDTIWFKPIDLSKYKKIHHIGDIHGCNTVLQQYFDDNGGIKDDEFYIFLGDYIDRGVENVDVIKFLLSIKDRENVLMLEGNHERWLWSYANDCVTSSKEFELITKSQLNNSEINKKDIRTLYRKYAQCAYYKYHNNIYFVSHGGISTMPNNLTFMATDQLIKGVGKYIDAENIADTWVKTTPNNFYQIHGHRNIKQLPIQVNERVFNLEGKVEFGGHLRCLQIDKNGIYPIEIENKVFKPSNEVKQQIVNNSIADIIIDLRSNKYIQEKNFGNISSFNFSSRAFYDKVWDEQTTKARGLYIDITKSKVVARAYEKFFNINERPETKFNILLNNLQFPVTAYVKENGFLTIVSYDEYKDDLFIATKSTINGEFTEWFKNIFYNKISSENIIKLKEYIRENNVSFVFECVDIVNDPHVIDYSESNMYLLDIVKNDIKFQKYDYKKLIQIANQFGLTYKEKAFEIKNVRDFVDWYYIVLDEFYEYNGRKIEGFVIEDSSGYMVKLKLTYYNFWKFMRSIAAETVKYGYSKRTSALVTPIANKFYAWIKDLCSQKDKNDIPKDICTLRTLFYEDQIENNVM